MDAFFAVRAKECTKGNQAINFNDSGESGSYFSFLEQIARSGKHMDKHLIDANTAVNLNVYHAQDTDRCL